MKIRRDRRRPSAAFDPATQDPQTRAERRAAALKAYEELCDILAGLDLKGLAALNHAYAQVSDDDRFRAVAEILVDLAYQHGRIGEDDRVVDVDPEYAAITELASRVSGGGAVDMAVAVLVHDLVNKDVYEKVVQWWADAGAPLPENVWYPPPATPEPHQHPTGLPGNQAANEPPPEAISLREVRRRALAAVRARQRRRRRRKARFKMLIFRAVVFAAAGVICGFLATALFGVGKPVMSVVLGVTAIALFVLCWLSYRHATQLSGRSSL